MNDVRQRLSVQGAVVDLSRVLLDIDELKLLHRTSAWPALPSRYAALRRQLLAIKAFYPSLPPKQKSALQSIIQQFSDIEQIVEQALGEGRQPPDSAELNRIAADQGDKLSAILITVQRAIGGEK